MTEKQISVGNAIRYGWHQTKSNFGFFIGILLVAAFVQVIFDVLKGVAGESWTAILFGILSAVVSIWIQIGLVRVAIGFCEEQKPEFSVLFSGMHWFIPYVIASILYGLIVMCGFILLIIPGIFLMLMLQFYNYLVIDRNLGPIDALKKSAELTRGVRLHLLWFWIVLGCLNLLGLLALVVGLFVTVPISMVAMAYVYRTLLAQTEGYAA